MNRIDLDLDNLTDPQSKSTFKHPQQTLPTDQSLKLLSEEERTLSYRSKMSRYIDQLQKSENDQLLIKNQTNETTMDLLAPYLAFKKLADSQLRAQSKQQQQQQQSSLNLKMDPQSSQLLLEKESSSSPSMKSEDLDKLRRNERNQIKSPDSMAKGTCSIIDSKTQTSHPNSSELSAKSTEELSKLLLEPSKLMPGNGSTRAWQVVEPKPSMGHLLDKDALDKG
eukprot:Awhi_evm1s1671